MLKIKHLRHPVRPAATARNLLAIHLGMRRFARRSRRHFQGDPRYDLSIVMRGLSRRPAPCADDARLLERICAAYSRAIERERSVPSAYQATGWWRQVRSQSLGPLLQALETADIPTLQTMYANFFRDPCATGLVGVPFGMYRGYFGRRCSSTLQHYLLGDILHGLDDWREQTQDRFPLRDLAGPDIGNPFGVLLDGTLIRPGAAFHHYSADRISACLGSSTGIVAEIGGGYGGMAYYLLRDRPGVTYINFDVPESIALASYYLITAFPRLNFRLYGEEPDHPASSADVVLLPLFEMPHLPLASVDIFFSSHAMSDLSAPSVEAYMQVISRSARRHFLYMGNARGAESIRAFAEQGGIGIRDIETRASGWNAHKHTAADQVECLYSISHAARADHHPADLVI